MIFKSPIISVATGKLAGMVFTRGRGNTNVARMLSIPTNPRSVAQTRVRGNLSYGATNWVTLLTAAQRASWETYAANVSVLNRLGDAIHLSGIAMFQRLNLARLAASLAQILDAPIVFTGAPAVSWDDLWTSDAGPPITLDNAHANPHAPDISGNLAFSFSKPQNPSKGFFNGPFLYSPDILASDNGFGPGETTAAVSFDTTKLPFPIAEGQALFLRTISMLEDGRISSPLVTKIIVPAPV